MPWPLRSVADGLAIEHRLNTRVQQGRPLRAVIAGGGIAGIEALDEILRRHRGDAGLSGEVIEVVEAGARLLPGLALDAAGRLWQSWRELALPQLLSLADLRKFPGSGRFGCCIRPVRVTFPQGMPRR